MNKTKIGLMLAGAFCATGAAHAMDFTAGENTVSLYGILDGSVYMMKQGTAPSSSTGTTSYGWASNNMTSSRLGFGVSRDLGDGLKIGGALEQEVEFATGGSGDGATLASASTSTYGNTGTAQFNRSANIFVSGSSWGEVRLGRQYAPSFSLAAASDALGSNSGGFLYSYVFADNVLGGLLLTGKGAAAGNGTINGGALAPNLFVDGLSFTSLNFSGVTVKLFQSFGSNVQPLSQGGSSNTGQSFSDGGITDITVRYAANGLTLGIGEQVVKASHSATYSGTMFNALELTAGYTLGDLKLSAGYNKVSFNSGFATATGGADDVTTMSVGGMYSLTKVDKLGLSYTSNKDSTDSSNKLNLVALQYDRTLGKDADAYAQYVSSHQSGAGVFGLGGVYGATLPLADTSVNTLFIGARMKF